MRRIKRGVMRGVKPLLLATMALSVMGVLKGSVACSRRPLANPLTIDEASYENGDLVFRRGVGLVSNFVVSVDTSSMFSHVGIICKTGSGTFVIHVLPDEQQQNNDVVQMEPIAVFLSSDNASGFAMCRLAGDHRVIASRAVGHALDQWKGRVRYDYDLDSSNPRRLYCSELVWLAYKQAGIDLTDGVLDRVNLPFYQGRYIMISRLLNSRWLEKITQQ